MSNEWEKLGLDDAIELQEKFSEQFITNNTFKSGKLRQFVLNKCLELYGKDWEREDEKYVLRKKWIEGLDAEVFKVGSLGWKKGKIRINVTVEFLPDQPESVLDDIRKNMGINE